MLLLCIGIVAIILVVLVLAISDRRLVHVSEQDRCNALILAQSYGVYSVQLLSFMNDVAECAKLIQHSPYSKWRDICSEYCCELLFNCCESRLEVVRSEDPSRTVAIEYKIGVPRTSMVVSGRIDLVARDPILKLRYWDDIDASALLRIARWHGRECEFNGLQLRACPDYRGCLEWREDPTHLLIREDGWAIESVTLG